MQWLGIYGPRGPSVQVALLRDELAEERAARQSASKSRASIAAVLQQDAGASEMAQLSAELCSALAAAERPATSQRSCLRSSIVRSFNVNRAPEKMLP